MADAWEVEDIRLALRLDPSVKILPCIAKKKSSVKTVLLELLYAILDDVEGKNEN
jgi:hypothetical protein